jgi:predicted permease
MEHLWNDIRYGIRMLAKTPGVTLIAILTLMLGIGANTALFSVVNAVLLNPLPYSQPNQLIALAQRTEQFEDSSISYPNFLDWQKDNRTFASMAAYRSDSFNLTGNGDAKRLRGEMISADYFSQLGVAPLMGRDFKREDDRPGAAPVALISEGFWQRQFGSDHEILSKSITLNGVDYAIVGVVPPKFHSGRNNDVYVPLGQWTDPTFLDRRLGMGLRAIGRLKPGATIEQASADTGAIAKSLTVEYPEADKGVGVSLVPLKKAMVGNVQPFLWVLLGAVGFVLLIACANVANLLLARATGRTREFAIRAALGATKGRVIRQLLTESVLLAITGGGLGLLLAASGTKAVLGILPSALPRSSEIGLDTHVLLFTLGISLFAGILFGLAPALRISRPDLQGMLKEGGRGSSGARHRAQGVFVAAEMALAVVLLIGAGLMIRSLYILWGVDPGFNPHNLLTFDLTMDPALIKNATGARGAMRELHQRVRAVPGVEAVSSMAGSSPMQGDSEVPFWKEGQEKPASDNDMSWSLFYLVEPDYLKVMDVPLNRGRFFNDHDDEHAPMVIVIDETFAHKYFPNEDPLGKRINLMLLGQAEIVGVVGHIKQWGLDSDAQQSIQAQFYMPILQTPDKFMPLLANGLTQMARTQGTPLGLTAAIRQTLQEMNSQQVMYGVDTMDAVIADSLAPRRFSMILLGIFAVLALVLSMVGIYGVISYLVGQRTHEIGVRVALGAQRSDVMRLVLGQGTKMALTGVAIGLAAALVLTRLMTKMLFGVSAADPLTFGGVAVLLTIVALAACYIPARRATRVDPMVALRYE